MEKDHNFGQVSEEVESNPMDGVKEIKGADKPQEPAEKIDIKEHQDAIDPDSNNEGHVHVHAYTAGKLANEPTKTTEVINKPKSKKTRRVLVILVTICLLCLLCCVLTYVFRDRLIQFITSPNITPSSLVTTVTPDQVKNSSNNFQSLLEEKKNNATVQADGTYIVSINEKEFLSAIFKEVDGIDPTSFGLKFEPGMARVQLNVGKIIESQKDNLKNSEQLKNLPVDLSLLSGVIVTADVVTENNGTKLKIENLTTGNPLLDSLIPQSTLDSLSNEYDLNNIVNENSNADNIDSGESQPQFNLKRIEFLEGEAQLTLME